jgi:hypothetical protein
MYAVGLDVLVIKNLFSFYNLFLGYSEKIVSFLFLNSLPIVISSKFKITKYSDDEIKQITFGSLLGDAKLELPNRGVNARFGFIQSQKYQDYFIQFYFIFETFCSSPYRTYNYLDPRTKKEYKSLSF